MATTGILFKGKIYAFGDEYPVELEESLKAQGKNRFGEKVTLSAEEAERLGKDKSSTRRGSASRGANNRGTAKDGQNANDQKGNEDDSGE